MTREGPCGATRTFVAVFVSGFFSVFAFSALDGELPDFSAAKWAVFLAGMVVIALAFIEVDRLRRSRSAGR